MRPRGSRDAGEAQAEVRASAPAQAIGSLTVQATDGGGGVGAIAVYVSFFLDQNMTGYCAILRVLSGN